MECLICEKDIQTDNDYLQLPIRRLGKGDLKYFLHIHLDCLVELTKEQKEQDFRECFIYCFDCSKALGSIKIIKEEVKYVHLEMKAFCSDCNLTRRDKK